MNKPRMEAKKREDLAILGGAPTFRDPLHVGRPNIGNRARFLAYADDILRSRWLTNDGPLVQEFERRVAETLGVEHCICVCSGTTALGIAARALGLAGEVIVPSFTFVATAHALRWLGIEPVFCDIDSRSHTLDPSRVEELLTPRTSAILPVHLWGTPCDVEVLARIASENDLKLLFDAAHGFGCSAGGELIGSFGNAEILSFHANKVLNTFEGGAVLTNDADLADRVRLMRQFGFADYDQVIELGTNGKMPEVAAAMGLVGLDSFEQFVAHNRDNYLRYEDGLREVPGISLRRYPEGERHNYHYIVAEIHEEHARVSRDVMQQALWAENVLARRYFYPGCHMMEPYRSQLRDASVWLPNTDAVAARVLTLPTGTAVGPSDVDQICQIMRRTVAKGPEVMQRCSEVAIGVV